MPVNDWLVSFVQESNKIEGLDHTPLQSELDAHAALLSLEQMSVKSLETFVTAIAPGQRLRAHKGLDVRVGAHVAPPGGIFIKNKLAQLLREMPKTTAYRLHCEYEQLHPFTDGNGRSGRALWLFHIFHFDNQRAQQQARNLGFLHTFYYQTLEALK